MDDPAKRLDLAEQSEPEGDRWDPGAWVYFLWIAFGSRVYCKIGYSTNPASRFAQIATGFPERPYRVHLLPCLTVEQAKIVESILHDRLAQYRIEANGFRTQG